MKNSINQINAIKLYTNAFLTEVVQLTLVNGFVIYVVGYEYFYL